MILGFLGYNMDRDLVDEYIEKIQRCLSKDLLSPRMKKVIEKQPPRHKTAGHCYITAEALYHLLGGKEKGLKPFVAMQDTGITHWWLEWDGEIVDPSKEQFTSENRDPPYHLGVCKGFLTKKPSKRAKILMDRVMKKVKIGKDTFILDETPACSESKKAGKEMADKLWKQVKGSVDRKSIRPVARNKEESKE